MEVSQRGAFFIKPLCTTMDFSRPISYSSHWRWVYLPTIQLRNGNQKCNYLLSSFFKCIESFSLLYSFYLSSCFTSPTTYVSLEGRILLHTLCLFVWPSPWTNLLLFLHYIKFLSTRLLLHRCYYTLPYWGIYMFRVAEGLAPVPFLKQPFF